MHLGVQHYERLIRVFIDSGIDSLPKGPSRETVDELIRTHKSNLKIGDYFQSRAFQAGAEQRTGDVPKLLSQLDQNEDGLSCVMRVLELRRDILSRSPQDKSARRNPTVALEKVGNSKLKLGEPASADEYYEQSLLLCEQLYTEDLKNLKFGHGVAMSHFRRAVAQ